MSHPRVVAHFDFAAGETPENIAVEPDGSADLTFAFARQVAHVTRHGDIRGRVTLPGVANPNTPLVHNAIVLGIARAHDGTLYVTYATGTAETGVWRIRPVAARPGRSHRGVLYAADSVHGTVWRVPVTGGPRIAWATGTPLTPVPSGTGFGANGSAGPIRTRATGLPGIDDFSFTSRDDDTVLAAVNRSNQVVVVRPDGTHSVVLTQQDGLSNPTSVAVRPAQPSVSADPVDSETA